MKSITLPAKKKTISKNNSLPISMVSSSNVWTAWLSDSEYLVPNQKFEEFSLKNVYYKTKIKQW